MALVAAARECVRRMLSESPGMKCLVVDKWTLPCTTAAYTQSEILAQEVFLVETLGDASDEEMRHLKVRAGRRGSRTQQQPLFPPAPPLARAHACMGCRTAIACRKSAAASVYLRWGRARVRVRAEEGGAHCRARVRRAPEGRHAFTAECAAAPCCAVALGPQLQGACGTVACVDARAVPPPGGGSRGWERASILSLPGRSASVCDLLCALVCADAVR